MVTSVKRLLKGQTHGRAGGVPEGSLQPYHSKCGPGTSSIGIAWALLQMQGLRPRQDLLIQNLRFYKLPGDIYVR